VLKQARVAPITRTHLHTTRTFLRDASLNLDQVADHLLDRSLLHACAAQGSLPMVTMLLAAGADPNAVHPVRRPAASLPFPHPFSRTSVPTSVGVTPLTKPAPHTGLTAA
jgi:ankyrin repeat protein